MVVGVLGWMVVGVRMDGCSSVRQNKINYYVDFISSVVGMDPLAFRANIVTLFTLSKPPNAVPA